MLAPLREGGFLIIGSGNLVHNLHVYDWSRRLTGPFDWAVRFEERVRELLLAADDNPLINYRTLGNAAMPSIPTPDHYLPLLYVIACRKEGEKLGFSVKGVDGGSISMLAVQIG
jgi:4,5-DOPA dioxygenase extradiol